MGKAVASSIERFGLRHARADALLEGRPGRRLRLRSGKSGQLPLGADRGVGRTSGRPIKSKAILTSLPARRTDALEQLFMKDTIARYRCARDFRRLQPRLRDQYFGERRSRARSPSSRSSLSTASRDRGRHYARRETSKGQRTLPRAATGQDDLDRPVADAVDLVDHVGHHAAMVRDDVDDLPDLRPLLQAREIDRARAPPKRRRSRASGYSTMRP